MGLLDKIEAKLPGHSNAEKEGHSQTTSSNTDYNSQLDPKYNTGSTTSGSNVTGTGITGTSASGQGQHVPGTVPVNPTTGLADLGSTSGQGYSGQTGQGQYSAGQTAPGQGYSGQQTTSQLPGEHSHHGHHSHHHTGEAGVGQIAQAGLAQHEAGRHHEQGGLAQRLDPTTTSTGQGTQHTGQHHGHHGHHEGSVTRAAETGLAGGAVQHEYSGQQGIGSGSIGQQGLQSQTGAGAYDQTRNTGAGIGSGSIGQQGLQSQTGTGAYDQSRNTGAGSLSGQGYDSTTGSTSQSVGQYGSVSGREPASSTSAPSEHHDQQHGTVGFKPNAENPSAIPTAGGQKIGSGGPIEGATGSTSTGTAGSGLDQTSTTGATGQTTTGGDNSTGLSHNDLGAAYAAGHQHGSTGGR